MSTNKRYIQKYRPKWEKMDQFKGWLKPMPNNTLKAYCSLCNVVIKSHFCDLRKHGSSIKHLKAGKLVKKLESYDKSGEDMNISDEDIPAGTKWSLNSVEKLLQHVKLKWHEFEPPPDSSRRKEIWAEISASLATDHIIASALECSRKFRNMKIKYFEILEKLLRGESDPIRVSYFECMHELLSTHRETLSHLKKVGLYYAYQNMMESGADDLTLRNITKFKSNFEWTEETTNLFLDYLHEFKDFYADNEGESEETVWLTVGEQLRLDGLDLTASDCRIKWASLLDAYEEYKNDVEKTGALPLWPFYTKVRHVAKNVPISGNYPNTADNEEGINIAKVDVPIGGSTSKSKPFAEIFFDEDIGDAQVIDEDQDSSQPSSSYSTKNPINEEPFNADHIKKIQKLSENAAVWNRLNQLEQRLDDLAEQQKAYKDTNVLLSHILIEMNKLGDNLAYRTALVSEDEINTELMPGDSKEGIALISHPE